jgi:hypothetical protein
VESKERIYAQQAPSGRERGLFPEQVERWRQASQDANEKPVLTLTEQKDLDRRHQQDQREIKQL